MINWFAVFGFILFFVGLYGLSNKDWKWEHRWVAFSFFIFSFFLFSLVHIEEFNPALHECTEWECTLGDFLIQDNQNGNWHCSFYDEGIYDTGLRVSHITSEKEPISKCVSFREKTQAELDVDFCKENPDDRDKCYCIEQETKQYLDDTLYYEPCSKTGEELSLCIRGEHGITTCVSAVPISEKTYCDENPTDAELCSCIEVIGFPKLVATPDTDMQHVSCSYDNNDSSYFCEGFINQSRFASDDYCLYHSTDSSCITNLSIEFIEKCVRAVPKVKDDVN